MGLCAHFLHNKTAGVIETPAVLFLRVQAKLELTEKVLWSGEFQVKLELTKKVFTSLIDKSPAL